jgi:hypothetical protein
MDRDLDKLRDDYEKAVNARKIKAIVELNQIAEAGGINRSEIVKIDAAIAELRVGWTPASENQKWARLDRQGDRMDFKFSSDGAITCLTRTSAANSWKSSDGDVVINDSSRYRVIDMKVFIGGKPGDKPFLFVPLIFD